MPDNEKTSSSYLKYLPAIFHEDAFLGGFLLAFEQILTGLKNDTKPKKGLEEISAKIPQLFSPLDSDEIFKDLGELLDVTGNEYSFEDTKKEFLQWLASWAALSLRADWTTKQQCDLLANIIPLYQRRGTKANLVELLKIYAGEDSEPKVTEPPYVPFQINEHYLQIGTNTKIPCDTSNSQGLQIGVNTQIGGAIPHYFKVEVKLFSPTFELLKRQDEIVSALVDLQKPAHTYYDLTIHYETIQIGNLKRSKINENMLLGDLKIFTELEKNNV